MVMPGRPLGSWEAHLVSAGSRHGSVICSVESRMAQRPKASGWPSAQHNSHVLLSELASLRY